MCNVQSQANINNIIFQPRWRKKKKNNRGLALCCP